MKTMKCEKCPSTIRVLGKATKAWHTSCKQRPAGKGTLIPQYRDVEESS